jgi:hypothetical protein
MRSKPDIWTGAERICWLCTLMEHFVGTNSLEHAPVLLSGMASVHRAPKLARARQALFNLRQLSLSFVTTQSVKHAIALYNEHHYQQGSTGPYKIDPETLQFERADVLEDPDIARARAWLSLPIPYELQSIGIADPAATMGVQIGDAYGGVRVPVGPITSPLPPRRTHDLARVPRDSVRIPLADLGKLAREMDERDAQHPERRRGNWEQRLKFFSVLVPDSGKGLAPTQSIELADVKHLIGLPGSGKTTILMLLAVWLGRAGLKTMLVFPSIEVARQYMSDLAFHGIRVGMLVGQNPTTRREHAARIAEAIAASGGQGGFAHTIDGADSFAANCVLPAFATDDTSLWRFGYAPCEEVLQGTDKNAVLRKKLCPVWMSCGRNKAPRDLLDADIWVGHVLSMDTRVPAHAIDAKIRYFELIARTFDVIIFDEADMVQSNLDAHGAAVMSISGSSDSIHRQIQAQIHDRFARGENHRLFDRNIELFSRDLAEFGNHNYTLISIVQNIEPAIRKRFADQLLTTSRIISELRDGLKRRSRRDQLDDEDVKRGFTIARALTDLWDTAAYAAFYDRTGVETSHWPKADICSRTLGIERVDLEARRHALIGLFRRYLAENLNLRRDELTAEIATVFAGICFVDGAKPHGAVDAIRLLVSITFMILGYQRIVPGTRQMVAEDLIRDPPIKATATPELRRFIPENIVGSLSGVKYSMSVARTTMTGPQNVELSYISFGGAPRMLMHRFGRLLESDGVERAPAVLLTSATSFLEASPAYHIDAGPHYLLRPERHETPSEQGDLAQDSAPRDRTRYVFKWLADRHQGDAPLRYSGAGDLAHRNLEHMVEELVRGGREKSEIYKAIRNFDVRAGVMRKAALVVNSYEQARLLKRYLDDYHRESTGRRTKTIVRSLENGENPNEYITPSQAEALGDDEHCDIIIFPLTAIGRGVNIVFTKGPRARDAAIGSIYFLTRPHPSGDDMQLLQSLAGRATQNLDQHVFGTDDDVRAIARKYSDAKRGTFRLAKRLLQEPLQASRLGAELFKPFTANQMVAILQTIGRGMRNGCPVAVHFVDAAWAPRSTGEKADDGRTSMLVQMRLILEECVAHEDPAIRAIYRELYMAFLEPLRRVDRVIYPEDLQTIDDGLYSGDGFDDENGIWEM